MITRNESHAPVAGVLGRSVAALVGAVVIVAMQCASAVAADAPLATLDLATKAGADAVQGNWRYSDVDIVAARFPAADAEGKPNGPEAATYDFTPHAGARDFDDSQWQGIAPESLAARRGHGRLSFNWYRVRLTLPESIDGVAIAGKAVELAVRLDDYAEVWIDGELARPFGSTGASVIAGWNALNRVTLSRHARPGQQVQVAIFGINGPISDAPTNYVFVREARLEILPGREVPVALTPREVNVQVTRLDPAMDRIVSRNPKLYKLAEGFDFTEGPIWSRREHVLYFSDPNRNRIYRYAPPESLTVFKEHSGYDGPDIACLLYTSDAADE